MPLVPAPPADKQFRDLIGGPALQCSFALASIQPQFTRGGMRAGEAYPFPYQVSMKEECPREQDWRPCPAANGSCDRSE